MSAVPMDVDANEEEVEVPSSSTSKLDKKRFEVKKVGEILLSDLSFINLVVDCSVEGCYLIVERSKIL